MAAVFIGVGSNIDPFANIPLALGLLSKCVRIRSVSTFWETDPIGSPESPKFVNGVVCIETRIKPRKLKFNVLRWLEVSLGRERTGDKYAPRPIDLDILLYGILFINEPDLVIPDPDIRKRAFVARGLYELCPRLRLPDNGESIFAIADRLDAGGMRELTDFTQELRRELAL